MSQIIEVSSLSHFDELLGKSTLVVTDFYADWCGPCKAIAPVYSQLANALSRPGRVSFTRVDVDAQQPLAQRYGITAMPTFMLFHNGAAVDTVKGADPQRLQAVVQKVVDEAGEGSTSTGASGSGSASNESSSTGWLGAGLPRGYKDITSQVDLRGLDLLNADASTGGVRVLFEGGKPSSLRSGKAAAKNTETKDWVESDTDEQLMLFVPFQSTLKVHTLQITSLPPKEAETNGELPMRPKTLQIFSNRAHCLGFAEAEDIPATHSATLEAQDWDEETGTAKIELRFVKFQNVTSLVVFVVDGDGDGEKVRVDRIKVVGEAGEKREMGKLEKMGDEP